MRVDIQIKLSKAKSQLQGIDREFGYEKHFGEAERNACKTMKYRVGAGYVSNSSYVNVQFYFMMML